VTLADLIAGELPSSVKDLVGAPGAWATR
jgi:hypothetical protein